MGDMCRPRHMQLKTAEVSRGGGSLLILSSFASDFVCLMRSPENQKSVVFLGKPIHIMPEPVESVLLTPALKNWSGILQKCYLVMCLSGPSLFPFPHSIFLLSAITCELTQVLSWVHPELVGIEVETGGRVRLLGPWLKRQVVRPMSSSFQVKESVGKGFSPRESPTPATEL
jgi:hypothetical protein